MDGKCSDLQLSCKEEESESSLTGQQLRDGIYRAEEKTDTPG